METARPVGSGSKIERLAVFVLCGCIGWFYLWTVRSSGDSWNFGREQNDYYNLLIDGYLDGQLHMKVEVPEALLKLANPYDPGERPPGLGLHDASFYKGKYYIYFGAAPMVLLMLPFRFITGVDLPLAAAVLIFVYLGFLASTGIYLAVRRRYFPQAGALTVLLGVLVLGLASATPALLRRPDMWELPIGGGYCFAMLSLGCVGRSLHAVRRRAWWFAGAGLFLGLAIASRPTYLFASIFLAVPLLAWWRREKQIPWRMAFAAALPLAAVGAAMAWHNHARFGSPLQFGQSYQFSLDYESKLPHFAPAYVPFTAHAHFFAPAEWSRYFPFIARGDLGAAPKGFTIHRGDIYGILNHFPIAWLALLAPLALWRRTASDRETLGAWLGAATLLFGGAAAVMLSFFSVLARYQVDFVPAFMVLVGVGLLAVQRWLGLCVAAGWRRLAMAAVGTAAIFSAAFGALFTLQFDGLLVERNPLLAQRAAQFFNHVPSLIERALGVKHGPIELNVRVAAGAAKRDETLATIGRPPQVDRVIVRHMGDGRVQFGLAPADTAERFSEPLTLTPDAVHRVRVSLASLFPPATHPFFAGRTPNEIRATLRRAEIMVDGEVVLREHLRLDRAGVGQVRMGQAELLGRTGPSEIFAAAGQRPVFHGNDLSGPGDTLRLTVRLPATRPVGRREPLVVTGRSGAGDLLLIEYLAGDEVRFALDHWGSPLRESPPLRLSPGQTHTIDITLTSLASVEDATLVRAVQSGEARVSVNGVKIWSDKTYFFSAEAPELWIGRNGIGGTACGPEFTGEVREVLRLGSEQATRVVRE